jgi:hypothetical protein
MKPIKLYLIAYNFASALGWAYVLYLAVTCFHARDTPKDAWVKFGKPLMVVQTTMAMEILHALVGFVPSPVFVTALQVSSRLWVVWGATYYAPECQSHWSLYLMVISWCLAEVPRYLFYVSNLATGSVPGLLFFVRYSAFMVLYPTGITGEIFQCVASLNHWATAAPVWHRGLQLILLAYAPGSPFMIGNMFGNRKSATKKRREAASPRPVSGLSWPVTDPKTKERGSTPTNKAVWEAAIKAVDEAAAAAVKREKNWRYGYVKHVEANVKASLKSPAAALKVAEAGLTAAHKLFQFVRDGKETSLHEAMDTYTKGTLETATVKGTGPKRGAAQLSIPYGGKTGQPYYNSKAQRMNEISGAALKAQLEAWVTEGAIEPDCAAALEAVAANPEWLDLSDHYFVLLGAGSAMGPLPLLLAMGANIYAVDIDRRPVWERLIKMALASSGTFTFPIRASKLGEKAVKDMSDDELAAVAGADLLNETPELATWLGTVCPQKRVTVGNYTYLDGALHVQLSLACDAIISKLSEVRPDLALAFLCTPTDAHAVPKEAHDAAKAHAANAPWWTSLVPTLVHNALPPVRSDNNKDLYYVDGVVAAQGPNYILAKRLQHWRAMLEFSRGHTISSNIAPSTATASVVHNAQFAAAYGGMHHFKPMEVMYAETSNAVMGALLVHDVRNPAAPARAGAKLENPLHIFKNGGFHGGTWRCGFKMGSIGEASAVIYYLGTYGAAISAVLAVAVALGVWVATGNLAGTPCTYLIPKALYDSVAQAAAVLL